MSKAIISEKRLRQIIRQHILEQSEIQQKEEPNKPRCVAGNIIPLDDIVGPSDSFKDYAGKLRKRDGGIHGMIDSLDMLRTLRLHPDINDSGEHLAYNLMHHLNKFRKKNYFDETNNGCISAMDKVIELYKENEHGEELVKDIEKVYGMQHVSARAKEFLKHGMGMIKGQ